MFVSNLDFSVMSWYWTCDPLRWFSILKPDRAPRPAYTALDGMAKNPRSWSVFGMEASPELSWMMGVRPSRGLTPVTVLNTGEGAFGWTARRRPRSWG